MHRVVVNTGDSSYDGLLWDVDDQVVVLRNTTIHPGTGEAIKALGDVVIERRHIRFLQAPGDHL